MERALISWVSSADILGAANEVVARAQPWTAEPRISTGARLAADSAAGSAIPQDEGRELRLCALLRDVARGEESALAALYDATIGKAYGLALRITRKPEAAEEVVEEVFLQVWRDAGRFDPDRGKVLTWLLTICRSRALDYLRRMDEAELHPNPEELQTDVHAEGADPLAILEATERSSAVHAALARLQPGARQLVALAFFRGLTHQEIADFCRMPLGTVKTTLSRAFKQMRTYLASGAKEP